MLFLFFGVVESWRVKPSWERVENALRNSQNTLYNYTVFASNFERVYPSWLVTSLVSIIILLLLFFPCKSRPSSRRDQFSSLFGLCALGIFFSHSLRFLQNQFTFDIAHHIVSIPILSELNQFTRVIFVVSGFLRGATPSDETQSFSRLIIQASKVCKRLLVALLMCETIELLFARVPLLHCLSKLPTYFYTISVEYECFPTTDPGFWTMPISIAAPFVLHLFDRFHDPIQPLLLVLPSFYRYWATNGNFAFFSLFFGARRFVGNDDLFGRMDDYMIGFYMARKSRAMMRMNPLITSICGIALWGISLSLFSWARYGDLGSHIAFAFLGPFALQLGISLLCVSISAGYSPRILSSNALLYIGRQRFGFYLLHSVTISYFVKPLAAQVLMASRFQDMCKMAFLHILAIVITTVCAHFFEKIV